MKHPSSKYRTILSLLQEGAALEVFRSEWGEVYLVADEEVPARMADRLTKSGFLDSTHNPFTFVASKKLHNHVRPQHLN